METYSNNLQIFVKKSLVRLATDTQIKHGNYECGYRLRNISISPLTEAIQSNNWNVDLGVKSLCDSIVASSKFAEGIDLIGKCDSGEDVDEYEIEEILYDIMEMAGLWEIRSIHGDNFNEFKEDLLQLFKDSM
jgi:hypothetical protein